MQILIYFLYALEVLICLLLAGLVLLQKPKEGGLGISFGGGMGEALFGAQMGNVLTKATIILGAAFLLNTIVLSSLTSRAVESKMEGVTTTAPAPAIPQGMPSFPQPSQSPSAPVAP